MDVFVFKKRIKCNVESVLNRGKCSTKLLILNASARHQAQIRPSRKMSSYSLLFPDINHEETFLGSLPVILPVCQGRPSMAVFCLSRSTFYFYFFLCWELFLADQYLSTLNSHNLPMLLFILLYIWEVSSLVKQSTVKSIDNFKVGYLCLPILRSAIWPQRRDHRFMKLPMSLSSCLGTIFVVLWV